MRDISTSNAAGRESGMTVLSSWADGKAARCLEGRTSGLRGREGYLLFVRAKPNLANPTVHNRPAMATMPTHTPHSIREGK